MSKYPTNNESFDSIDEGELGKHLSTIPVGVVAIALLGFIISDAFNNSAETGGAVTPEPPAMVDDVEMAPSRPAPRFIPDSPD